MDEPHGNAWLAYNSHSAILRRISLSLSLSPYLSVCVSVLDFQALCMQKFSSQAKDSTKFKSNISIIEMNIRIALSFDILIELK